MNLFAHLDRKKVMWGACGIAVLAAILFYLFTAKAPEPVVTQIEASPLEGVLGRDLLLTLERLKSTNLDTSVFQDPVFTSLQDFGVAIAPQPVGRRNPFAPFEGGGSAAAPASGARSLPAASKSSGSAPSKPASAPKSTPAGSAPENGSGDFVDFSF